MTEDVHRLGIVRGSSKPRLKMPCYQCCPHTVVRHDRKWLAPACGITHLHPEGRENIGKGVLNQGHGWEVCFELETGLGLDLQGRVVFGWEVDRKGREHRGTPH